MDCPHVEPGWSGAQFVGGVGDKEGEAPVGLDLGEGEAGRVGTDGGREGVVVVVDVGADCSEESPEVRAVEAIGKALGGEDTEKVVDIFRVGDVGDVLRELGGVVRVGGCGSGGGGGSDWCRRCG